MVFWAFVFVIRFEERKTAQKKVKRHIHNTDRFYDDLEKRPGNLSLKDEILLCPWRFISRVILWPFYFLKYPWYESTAEMLRYNRLKAEFLRYKPTGYQLSQPRRLGNNRHPIAGERLFVSLFSRKRFRKGKGAPGIHMGNYATSGKPV